MNRVVKEFFTVSQFHQIAQVHNTDAVTDVLDHGKVMRNEQVGRAGLLLDILHQVNDLCLNGNVQRRDRLITYDEFRFYSKCTGDTDTLLLSAGELMRITVCMLCI